MSEPFLDSEFSDYKDERIASLKAQLATAQREVKKEIGDRKRLIEDRDTQIAELSVELAEARRLALQIANKHDEVCALGGSLRKDDLSKLSQAHQELFDLLSDLREHTAPPEVKP